MGMKHADTEQVNPRTDPTDLRVIDPAGVAMADLAQAIDTLDLAARSGPDWQVVYSFEAVPATDRHSAHLLDGACGFAPISFAHLQRVALLGNAQAVIVAALKENAARRDFALNPNVGTLHALNEALAATHDATRSIVTMVRAILTPAR